MQRRRILKIVGAFFLGYALDIPSTFASSPPTLDERATFAAFLDTLLPRDALCGSATDLRVDSELWAVAEKEAQFRRLIHSGCQWLDMTGGPPFPELSDVERIAVVDWMSTSDWNEVPRRFYELVRQVAVEVYYSNPASWRGLPIQSPPQPTGYPPPWP